MIRKAGFWPFPATILLRNDWLLSLIGALLCRLGCGSRRPLDHALPGGLPGGAEVGRRRAAHEPQRIPSANPNRSPNPGARPRHDRSREAGGVTQCWRSGATVVFRPKLLLETRSRICAVSISKVFVHDGRAYFRNRRPIICRGICCSLSSPIGFKPTALAT